MSTGAVLSQMQDGRERVIAYASHTMTRSERNFCVTDKELLAVKRSIQHFKHYLLGRRFTVRSDHQVLKWLFSLKEPKSRVARWIEDLSAYDFQIEYRPGKSHGNADGMSRCPNPQQCQCKEDIPLKCGPCAKCVTRGDTMKSSLHEPEVAKRTPAEELTTSQHVSSHGFWSGIVAVMFSIILVTGLITLGEAHTCNDTRVQRATESWVLPHIPAVIRRKQLQDPDIGLVLKWMEAGERPGGEEVSHTSPATRSYWLNWEALRLQGQLFRRFPRHDGTGVYFQLLLPRELKQEVLNSMHNSPFGGSPWGQENSRKDSAAFLLV